MPFSDPEYLRRETWSLVEAAYLLSGEERVDAESIPLHGRAAHFYANLKDATEREGALPYFNERTGRIKDRRVRPWDAVQWAIARGDDIRADLRAVPEPKETSKPVDTAPAEKPLTTTERNSLLVIVAALSKHAEIPWNGRGASVRIANLTESLGARVSDDTVRDWLKRIPEALESRKK